MSGGASQNKVRVFLQEFSIPLIGGVLAALFAANLDPKGYHEIIHHELLGGVNLHFLVNDIFMVLFFGIATKEITESCLPGGALNPLKRAINPLFATLGGVCGPVAVFLGFVYLTGNGPTYANGWGIPTATDIALAWLVARMVFGKGHPAVNFLLLLAVVDDGIGLGIIAIFYPDAAHPVEPMWLVLTAAAAVCAYALRRFDVRQWPAYVLGPGVLAWIGLHTAHLHPALALCVVVPFMPSARKDAGLFVEEIDAEGHVQTQGDTLNEFEHGLKTWVDFGLFFFAFANAGVEMSDMGWGTWYVLVGLLIGKTVGVTLFSWLAIQLGFPLPDGMSLRALVVTGLIAGIGLTVALFVSGEAYSDAGLQAEAKMGALLSGGAAFLAIALGKMLRLKEAAVEVAGVGTESGAPVAPAEWEILGKSVDEEVTPEGERTEPETLQES